LFIILIIELKIEKISNMKKIKKFKNFNRKRKKTLIKKISDAPYNWTPQFDRNSPAPESNYSIGFKSINI